VVAAHYTKDDPLNCWTSSSDISGYHGYFHEGHGPVGTGQGPGMSTAWYGMCELALKVRLNDKSVGLNNAIKHTEWCTVWPTASKVMSYSS